ncbi:VWA domain-containing protein [soil metagenome]
MRALHPRETAHRVAVFSLLAGMALASFGCGQGGSSAAPCKASAYKPITTENPPAEPENTENYNRILDNPYLSAKQDPLSTFSANVDTASYSNLRRFLNEGTLPPPDSVRIADMINYFDYDYPEPRGSDPVGIRLELAACPWQSKHHLLRIALKARTLKPEEMPARNFVFLVDTSGSMNASNRLPLVQKSLQLLVEQLTARDRVSMVTYAGNAGLALRATPGDQKQRMLQAIDNLSAGGSTNGAGGIHAAYEQAESVLIDGGVNRVILATDGDFNVGVSSETELVRLIEKKRHTGIYLTVLGYGMGNLKDSKLEQLAHHGNGHYAYIDSIDEARKVFVDQGGALAIVAKDVKLQVEFNHARVNAYRLIGYENRVLRNEQFRDDAADAGEMGSGHTCTALYEIVPHGVGIETPESGLKYQRTAESNVESKAAANRNEWLTVRMRYKHPDRETAEEMSVVLPEDVFSVQPSSDFRWAAAVTAYGLILRDSPHKGTATLSLVRKLAETGRGNDPQGYRDEFFGLLRKTERLTR